jgi:hypothetical protein
MGLVNWRQLATFITLLRSPLPTDSELESYKKSLVGSVDKKAFLAAKAWFDKTEYSQDRDYSVPFPRLQLVKELLFIVNREHVLPEAPQQERVSSEALFQVLGSAKALIQANSTKKAFIGGIKTYGDVLFMQANLVDVNASPKKKKKAA